MDSGSLNSHVVQFSFRLPALPEVQKKTPLFPWREPPARSRAQSDHVMRSPVSARSSEHQTRRVPRRESDAASPAGFEADGRSPEREYTRFGKKGSPSPHREISRSRRESDRSPLRETRRELVEKSKYRDVHTTVERQMASPVRKGQLTGSDAVRSRRRFTEEPPKAKGMRDEDLHHKRASQRDIYGKDDVTSGTQAKMAASPEKRIVKAGNLADKTEVRTIRAGSSERRIIKAGSPTVKTIKTGSPSLRTMRTGSPGVKTTKPSPGTTEHRTIRIGSTKALQRRSKSKSPPISKYRKQFKEVSFYGTWLKALRHDGVDARRMW